MSVTLITSETKKMRNIRNQPTAAAIGAIIVGWNMGIGAAAAADFRVPDRERPAPPAYYSQQPAELYGPPPVVYGYPPPPPVAYYDYGPAPVFVVPGPYYLRRPYALGYGDLPYRARGYGPNVARIYGGYGPRGPFR
jgi:hypothetical protein